MASTLRAPVRIETPPAAALAVGGLLAVANVIEAPDEHYMNGVQYESWVCGRGGIAPGLCDVAPGVEIDPTKLFDGPVLVTGYPFAVYTGVECDLFGHPYTQAATGRLEGSEEFLVGLAFEQLVMGSTDPAPVQVCDDPDADICDVIGLLEQWAGENYAGRPILHMNRYQTAQAISAHQVVPQLDGSLATVQGTPVANSPGYDERIFVTGPVNLWRTPVRTYDVDAPMRNQAQSLAERVYVASWECITGFCGDPVTPAPVVSSVSPTSGSADGVAITITGSGFLEGA